MTDQPQVRSFRDRPDAHQTVHASTRAKWNVVSIMYKENAEGRCFAGPQRKPEHLSADLGAGGGGHAIHGHDVGQQLFDTVERAALQPLRRFSLFSGRTTPGASGRPRPGWRGLLLGATEYLKRSVWVRWKVVGWCRSSMSSCNNSARTCSSKPVSSSTQSSACRAWIPAAWSGVDWQLGKVQVWSALYALGGSDARAWCRGAGCCRLLALADGIAWRIWNRSGEVATSHQRPISCVPCGRCCPALSGVCRPTRFLKQHALIRDLSAYERSFRTHRTVF